MTRIGLREELEKISADENLIKDLEILPKNYTFEVPKTIWKIRSTDSKLVALQMPEGLLLYACIVSDILVKYTGCETIIMGDVTYGACCVDDYTAKALGCDLLVHYGHSCLVPIQDTVGIHMLYVFVNIDVNVGHFIDSITHNFEKEKSIAFVSTVQFLTSLHTAKNELNKEGYNVFIPQCSPLSPGEILGCTSPKLPSDTGTIVYLAELLTREEYGFDLMVRNRQKAVEAAQKSEIIGLIQGTLGRQGNIKIFEDIEEKLIFVARLACFDAIQSFVQVACPRLSIDWGTMFDKPLLTPYELAAALEYTEFNKNEYPMDFYAYDSRGAWTNNHEKHRPRRQKRTHVTVKNE
ncbi:Diphthamide biosynthesis protein 1 [Aphelenchoides bicaudatus]|nr:Diphthamide biosynthesis protein 1 [Aphelenchoides bicaudatus]